MSDLPPIPPSPDEVITLFPLALSGDRQAQDELFRRIEPTARRMATYWLRRYRSTDRIRVTEIIGEAFTRLVPPEGGTQPALQPWPDFGRFCAFLCRTTMQVLIDQLRTGGARGSSTLPELLAEEFEGDRFLAELGEAKGDVDKVSRAVSNAIWGDRLAQRILKAGSDPSQVQRVLKKLLACPQTQQRLHHSGPDGSQARAVLLEVVRSDDARKQLPRYQGQSGLDAGEDGPSMDPAAPVSGLTANSLLTLRDALEKLDEEYAVKPATPMQVPGLSERRSSHAQIIDLRVIAGYTWQEIGRLLGLPYQTVEARAKVALKTLRGLLGDSFNGVLADASSPGPA